MKLSYVGEQFREVEIQGTVGSSRQGCPTPGVRGLLGTGPHSRR